jgi:hypothetical protein
MLRYNPGLLSSGLVQCSLPILYDEHRIHLLVDVSEDEGLESDPRTRP